MDEISEEVEGLIKILIITIIVIIIIIIIKIIIIIIKTIITIMKYIYNYIHCKAPRQATEAQPGD